MEYLYSPYPAESYRMLEGAKCEVGWIQEAQYPLALWNLFWLSNPSVDRVLDRSRPWWLSYRPQAGLLKALVEDLHRDSTRMVNRLEGHPLAFRVWFDEQPHEAMSLWQLGGQEWVDAVVDRADEAAARYPITFKPSCKVLPLRPLRA